MNFIDEKKRKDFADSTKKSEWLLAGGRDPKGEFSETSKCRGCGLLLTWGDKRYEFDHFDNDNSNNRQSNCRVVCLFCHRQATGIKVINENIGFGYSGKKTIKLKVGYKKVEAEKAAAKKAKELAAKKAATKGAAAKRVAAKKAKELATKKAAAKRAAARKRRN
ncbi:hypothetical protein ACFLU4_05065 [Chloroflexota bacterium]